MTTAFPRASPEEQVGAVRRSLEGQVFAEAGHVYLVEGGRIVGQVPIESVLRAPADHRLAGLQGKKPLVVREDEPAEAAALAAVHQHESDVAVVDAQQRLVGVVATPTLLALLHAEHVEDYLRAAGVGKSHPAPHAPYAVWGAYRARVRWLLIGLMGGIGAGFIVRQFEATIEAELMLAAFLPVVVYLADAVGTQSEALVVRSLALGRQRFLAQFAHESLLGLLLGVSLGAVALAALLLLGISAGVSTVVATTILAASLVATILATCICWGAAVAGADPAMATGPVATVIQDAVSVATYLLIATWLL